MGEGIDAEGFNRRVIFISYEYREISFRLVNIFTVISLFSSGRVLGLEWSLHRHGEHPEEDKNGNWRRRIELCHGNC